MQFLLEDQTIDLVVHNNARDIGPLNPQYNMIDLIKQVLHLMLIKYKLSFVVTFHKLFPNHVNSSWNLHELCFESIKQAITYFQTWAEKNFPMLE